MANIIHFNDKGITKMTDEEKIICKEYLNDLDKYHSCNEYHLIMGLLDTELSVQPESSTEIQEILEYLDTTLHPIVSPDNLNVYAELHDMVSKLPPTQPERKWISVTEKLPEEDGIYIVSGVWGSGKKQVGECEFCVYNGHFNISWNFDVKAWMPLPEPYEEKKK